MPTAPASRFLPTLPSQLTRWDLFCRVIDNHGDVGVAWRLARALARRGAQVRLWLDDASALAWMAPQTQAAGEPGIEVLAWTEPAPDLEPGDVVVETFGCDPPPAFVARMAARAANGRPAPVWINLEYLSAEAYVERSHGLASPQWSGPGRGLSKWFFYPGFTPRTGGLMHHDIACGEVDLQRRWLQQQGWVQPGEWALLMFCYDGAPLAPLLQRLAAQAANNGQALRLLACPGGAQRTLAGLDLPASTRITALPWLTQPDFDRALAGSDAALVRGEDSFVRAQLQVHGPVLWQIYAQHDGAHAAKLQAWLQRLLYSAEPGLAAGIAQAQRAVNGLGDWPEALPSPSGWAALQAGWRASLLAQPDLVDQLCRFVIGKTLE